MTQLELDFNAPSLAPKTEQPQAALAQKILAFPLARHARSAIRFGLKLRPLPQSEREKIWGQRTGQLIRARVAAGLPTEAAIADVSAWAVFARAALFNPPPEPAIPKKLSDRNNIIFPDFLKAYTDETREKQLKIQKNS